MTKVSRNSLKPFVRFGTLRIAVFWSLVLYVTGFISKIRVNPMPPQQQKVTPAEEAPADEAPTSFNEIEKGKDERVEDINGQIKEVVKQLIEVSTNVNGVKENIRNNMQNLVQKENQIKKMDNMGEKLIAKQVEERTKIMHDKKEFTRTTNEIKEVYAQEHDYEFEVDDGIQEITDEKRQVEEGTAIAEQLQDTLIELGKDRNMAEANAEVLKKVSEIK